MHFDINNHIVYMAKHGSHAYGTNIEGSDLDIKGIAIPPRDHVLGFAYTFEELNEAVSHGHPADRVVYSLQKFCKLAADCNPNIIEVLFVDRADVITNSPYAAVLREAAPKFLSRKARHTFSGYAVGQLKRIRSHRSWLLNPPKGKPERKDFGLPENIKISDDMMGAYDKLLAGDRTELKIEGVNPNVMELVQKEKSYFTALKHFQSYEKWKAERNTARAALEAKYGYDTKHAMHLVRLLRMCREILTGKGVLVKRPDAEELLAIRRGEWTYDQLIEWAEREDNAMQELYDTSPLPHAPDREFLNALCVKLHEDFWGFRNPENT